MFTAVGVFKYPFLEFSLDFFLLLLRQCRRFIIYYSSFVAFVVLYCLVDFYRFQIQRLFDYAVRIY